MFLFFLSVNFEFIDLHIKDSQSLNGQCTKGDPPSDPHSDPVSTTAGGSTHCYDGVFPGVGVSGGAKTRIQRSPAGDKLEPILINTQFLELNELQCSLGLNVDLSVMQLH